MKIMTAMYTMKKGGAYDRFKMMLEAFLERRCEVHCLSLTPIQILHPSYHNHVAALPSKFGNGWVKKLMILSLFPLYSLWIGWRQRIDLFVAFGSLYAFIQAVPKWLLRKSMVTLIRGDSSFGLRSQGLLKYSLWLNRAIEYIGIFCSDRIITVNTAIRNGICKSFRRWKDMDIEVLFNDVPVLVVSRSTESSETRNKYGVSQAAKVMVTAGIINRGKNTEILIKCLPRTGVDNLFLLVVGAGSTAADVRYQNYLNELTKTLGLERNVIFTGWVEKEELWKIFDAADLFILPSRSEGMPNAMLEALGFDLPCFGSRIPGIADILQYDQLMFDPSNEVTLAGKVRQLFSDAHSLSEVRRLCQERKKEFIFDWKERVFETVTREIRL